MKKLYCVILLLVMPSVYGMQKKTKPRKKFNIHNVQKKSGKKDKIVMAKQKQLREEQYQLKRASMNLARAREELIMGSILLGGPLLLYTFVHLDHYTRGMSCARMLDWCIDKTYSTAPF